MNKKVTVDNQVFQIFQKLGLLNKLFCYKSEAQKNYIFEISRVDLVNEKKISSSKSKKNFSDFM